MIVRCSYSNVQNCSIILGVAIVEGIGSYLTLCTTPLDGTRNIDMQVSLDYISETQDGLFLSLDPLNGIPSKVYA